MSEPTIFDRVTGVLGKHHSVAPTAGHIADHCVCGIDTSNMAKHQAAMLSAAHLLVRPESEADSVLHDHRVVTASQGVDVCACGLSIAPEVFGDHIARDLAAAHVLVG